MEPLQVPDTSTAACRWCSSLKEHGLSHYTALAQLPSCLLHLPIDRRSCILRSWLRRIVALHLLKVLADVVAYFLLDVFRHAVVDVYARVIYNRRRVFGFALWVVHTPWKYH